MKKFLPIFTVIAILGGLLPIQINEVRAYDEQVDQQNTVISQAYVVIYNYGWNQTFTPELDHLTKVQVYLKDRRGGSGIELTVKDETLGTTVAQASQRMDDGDGWEVFLLPGSGEGFEIVPGHLHSLWLETSYYTEEPIPKWVKSGTNSYAGGARRQNQTAYGDDLPFATWGYMSETEPPEPIPDEDDTDGENGQTQEGEDDQTTVQKITPEEAQAEIDETIEVPELSYITKNDEQTDAPVEETVEVSSDDTLTLVGTSFANATVVIFIGEEVYYTNADADGNWSLKIDPETLSEGTYTVKAQAQNEEEKGSEIVEFFTLTKLNEQSEVELIEPQETELSLWQKLTVGPLRIYTIIALSLILAGLIALLLFIVWKREKKEKKSGRVEADKSKELKQKASSKEQVENK